MVRRGANTTRRSARTGSNAVGGVIRVRNLMNDSVTIVHKDGSKIENVWASVQKEKIFITDVTVSLSVGDRIERQLPSGKREVLTITHVHLWSGRSRISSHYEIAYEREDVQQRSSRPVAVNVHVSDSPHARVNLNSTDQSNNIISNQNEDIFSQIRDILRESVDDSRYLSLLLEKVEDMESSHGSSDFTRAYIDFIATAANHMTVLAPFIPSLTALL